MPYDKATEGCPAMQYTTVAEPDAGAHAIYTEMLSNYKALEDVSTSPADGTTPQATFRAASLNSIQVWFAIHWSAFSSSFSRMTLAVLIHIHSENCRVRQPAFII